MLQPTGIPRKAWLQEDWRPSEAYPTWVSEAAAPCHILGATVERNCPVFSPDGCLPDSVGALVLMDRGVRRLLAAELGKAKGVPAEWHRQGDLMVRAVNQMTDLHIWTAVASSLTPTFPTHHQDLSVPADESDLDRPWSGFDSPGAETLGWEWVPPDLSEGGEWYAARVASLQAAVSGMPEADRLFQEGLTALAIHRENYATDDGTIKRLQLLWWEFPPEHWTELREGCPMNFLSEPTKGITPNAPMTAEQQEIATEFIDELWHIGVLELIPDDCDLKANAPLFTVAKPGQPGQWRCIADMKSGGQNAHIGKDPVHLPPGRTYSRAVVHRWMVRHCGCKQILPQLSDPSSG